MKKQQWVNVSVALFLYCILFQGIPKTQPPVIQFFKLFAQIDGWSEKNSFISQCIKIGDDKFIIELPAFPVGNMCDTAF